jgi:hypothetical protein
MTWVSRKLWQVGAEGVSVGPVAISRGRVGLDNDKGVGSGRGRGTGTEQAGYVRGGLLIVIPRTNSPHPSPNLRSTDSVCSPPSKSRGHTSLGLYSLMSAPRRAKKATRNRVHRDDQYLRNLRPQATRRYLLFQGPPMLLKRAFRSDRRRRTRQTLNAKVKIFTGSAYVDAVGINVSDVGMRLFTVADLPLGSQIQMEFSPLRGTESVQVFGTVRHRAVYLYGIEFLADSAPTGLACQDAARIPGSSSVISTADPSAAF